MIGACLALLPVFWRAFGGARGNKNIDNKTAYFAQKALTDTASPGVTPFFGCETREVSALELSVEVASLASFAGVPARPQDARVRIFKEWQGGEWEGELTRGRLSQE